TQRITGTAQSRDQVAAQKPRTARHEDHGWKSVIASGRDGEIAQKLDSLRQPGIAPTQRKLLDKGTDLPALAANIIDHLVHHRAVAQVLGMDASPAHRIVGCHAPLSLRVDDQTAFATPGKTAHFAQRSGPQYTRVVWFGRLPLLL